MIAPWKESYYKARQRIKKKSHHLPIKVCIVNAMVFPVGTYGCESWNIKKAEYQKELMFLNNCAGEDY